MPKGEARDSDGRLAYLLLRHVVGGIRHATTSSIMHVTLAFGRYTLYVHSCNNCNMQVHAPFDHHVSSCNRLWACIVLTSSSACSLLRPPCCLATRVRAANTSLGICRALLQERGNPSSHPPEAVLAPSSPSNEDMSTSLVEPLPQLSPNLLHPVLDIDLVVLHAVGAGGQLGQRRVRQCALHWAHLVSREGRVEGEAVLGYQ